MRRHHALMQALHALRAPEQRSHVTGAGLHQSTKVPSASPRSAATSPGGCPAAKRVAANCSHYYHRRERRLTTNRMPASARCVGAPPSSEVKPIPAASSFTYGWPAPARLRNFEGPAPVLQSRHQAPYTALIRLVIKIILAQKIRYIIYKLSQRPRNRLHPTQTDPSRLRISMGYQDRPRRKNTVLIIETANFSSIALDFLRLSAKKLLWMWISTQRHTTVLRTYSCLRQPTFTKTV